MRLNPSNTDHLYRQVADDLRRQIHAGSLEPGSRIPPFRDLVARYGVSLMTINKALTVLIAEGMVNSRVGRGTFVAEKIPSPGGSGRKLLGFVLRDLANPFHARVVQAVHERAEKAGFEVLLTAGSRAPAREDEQIERFLKLGVQALIISSRRTGERMEGSLRALRAADLPFVLLAHGAEPGVPHIGTDLERAGELAAEHLVTQGYRRFAYVNGRPGKPSGELRRRGYRRALERLGHTLDPRFEWSYPFPFSGERNHYRSGYAVGEQIAELRERPDAVFVFSDLGAIGLIDALLERGVRVPEEVAVVGMDGVEQGERARVPLTSVRSLAEEIGGRAVDGLVRHLAGEPMQRRNLVEPRLVVRRSCGAAWPADGERMGEWEPESLFQPA